MAAGHEELRNLDRPSEGGKAYGLGCPSLRVPYPEGEPKQQMDQEMFRRVPNRRDRAKGRRAQGEESDGSEQQEPRKSCRSPDREESHADFPGNSIALRTRSERFAHFLGLRIDVDNPLKDLRTGAQSGR